MGDAQATQGGNQAQAPAQAGDINHRQNQIRRFFLQAFTQDDLAGHGLVFALGMQAVGARQVHQRHGPTGGSAQESALELHRHARVIGHLLLAAREPVE